MLGRYPFLEPWFAAEWPVVQNWGPTPKRCMWGSLKIGGEHPLPCGFPCKKGYPQKTPSMHGLTRTDCVPLTVSLRPEPSQLFRRPARRRDQVGQGKARRKRVEALTHSGIWCVKWEKWEVPFWLPKRPLPKRNKYSQEHSHVCIYV